MKHIELAPPRKSLSISAKLFLLTGALILLALALINILNYQYTEAEMEERVLQVELPILTNELETLVQKELASPIALAKLTAHNDFLIEWIGQGEQSMDLIKGYLAHLKTHKPISVVNLVSDKTLRLYNETGYRDRLISSKDVWYHTFKRKGTKQDFNINYNKVGKLTLFINQRIENKAGEFMGLVGIGLDLEGLNQRILTKKIGSRGNIMMVDKNGFIKLHQDTALIDKNNEKRPAKNLRRQAGIGASTDALLKQNRQAFRYAKGNQNFVTQAVFIPEFQWFLLMEVCETEMLAPIYSIFLWNIAMGFLITIVIVLVGVWVIHRWVVAPLQAFGAGLFGFFDFLNRKSPTVAPIKVVANDELGRLAMRVNEHIKSIQAHIEQDDLLIKETVALVDNVAHGFLDKRLHRQGSSQELNHLKTEINQMLNRLEENVGHDVNLIIRTMQAYANMDFSTMIAHPAGEIEKNVNTMGQAIHEKQQEILQQNYSIAQKNLQISHNIRAAHTIQKAILPYPEKMKRLLGDYFVLNKPKDVVSGDFYWLNALPTHEDGKRQDFILVVADCTGHGVEGAFMTLIGSTLLDKIIDAWGVHSPADVLGCLHEEIFTILRQDETHNMSGMDAIVVRYQREQASDHATITFAGAKNELFYILPAAAEVGRLKGARKSIGGEQSAKHSFENQLIEVPSGTLLYACSDGLIDQNDYKRRRLGLERLHKSLLMTRDLSIEQQSVRLSKVLEAYMEDTHQRDDILCLGMRVGETA